jgi:hypothetical protein
VRREQHGAIRGQHRALDHVPQLADVARPAVLPEDAHRLVGNRPHGAVVLGRELQRVVLGECRDVVAALAQRREAQLADGQPVVEVRAEAPGRDGGLEVAIRGRDQAHVEGDRLVAADALDLALL